MDVRDLVRQHYGGGDLSGAIMRALEDTGVATDRLGPADLIALDQLHAGGGSATKYLLDSLDLSPGQRLLDVGCGIGGPTRLAAMTGVAATGVDLTPEFVETARILTERVGLGDRATFTTTAAEELPFEDDSFDAAMMVHVGMNVPDKEAVFAEVRRVLVPGGTFGLYEQMRTGEGELPYPLPWAEDEQSSFVESVEDYRRHLESAGFTVVDVQDRTASTSGAPPPGPVTNAVVFGPAFVERIGHNIAATKAGLLGAMVVLARA